MTTILITGGAGYIGSATVKALINDNDIVIIDNLSKGKESLIDHKAKFYKADLNNKEAIEKVFAENKIDAVIHFAAYKAVGESMTNPTKYSDNIIGTLNLLAAMTKHNVKKIIYSSSAAVYGTPEKSPVDEQHPTNPLSYYGYTKLACEQIIEWFNKTKGINYINLRYFNVAGDAGLNYVDPAAENIIPIIMEVISGKRDKLVIFGDDYDTRDGTGLRDYIDINDLVDAHVLALKSDFNGFINLGTSKGVTVKELIQITEEVSGKKVNFEMGERRKGDPSSVLASNEKAKEILGWQPKRTIKDMIKSTYDAYENSN